MLVPIIGLMTRLKMVTLCSYTGDAQPPDFKTSVMFLSAHYSLLTYLKTKYKQKGVYLSTHHFKYLHTRTTFQTKQQLMDGLMDGQMNA